MGCSCGSKSNQLQSNHCPEKQTKLDPIMITKRTVTFCISHLNSHGRMYRCAVIQIFFAIFWMKQTNKKKTVEKVQTSCITQSSKALFIAAVFNLLLSRSKSLQCSFQSNTADSTGWRRVNQWNHLLCLEWNSCTLCTPRQKFGMQQHHRNAKSGYTLLFFFFFF